MNDPIAWRRVRGKYGVKRFMTDKQYQAQGQRIKNFYEPFVSSQEQRIQELESAAREVLQEALDHAESYVHPCDVHDNEIKVKRCSAAIQKLYEAMKDDQN